MMTKMAAGRARSATQRTDRLIGASELATFAFCPRAWQLRYQERRPPAPAPMARGRAAHAAHAGRVCRARRLALVVTLLAGLALGGLAGAWFVLGGPP